MPAKEARPIALSIYLLVLSIYRTQPEQLTQARSPPLVTQTHGVKNGVNGSSHCIQPYKLDSPT